MCLHIFLSSDLSTAKLFGIKAALNHQNTGEASEGQCPVEVLARTHTSKANLNSYSLPFMDFCCKCICLKKRGTKSNLYDPELQQSGWSMQPFSTLFCVSVCVSVLLSAPVVLCLQELKLVLDPVTGIRSCEFQLLRRGLSWEKHKRRPDKKLVVSTRWKDIWRKREIKNKNIKVA